ncbi:hypothetical protein NEOLEDRAFT_1140800 [Neolentinus lepideus HHB14362 ss-1]|uniref:Zn(2)-C6 fungal-type domain-containing protein n=1 Tax=Neolentinus lepideus HHB14362 ss-1 TaxID=1314782 RepID=A0A165P086_9AGAM|nr:hypothetical protein NEOLEDRAFT_1140800 [Neolentinus lepideus HHB14362 ss-1]
MVKTTNHTSPGGTPGAQSAKRKKEDDDAIVGSSKKPRTRVSYSCGECHRRKQKCDRQVPCSHCVARKVPELCKAYQPGKSDQDLHLRIARLERIIESALPQFCYTEASTPASAEASVFAERQRSISEGPDDDTRSQVEDQDASGGTFQSGRWYGHSVSGSVAPASVLEQLQHVVGPSNMDLRSQDRTTSRSPTIDSVKVETTPKTPGFTHASTSNLATTSIIDSEPSAADKLKSLVQDCGVSPQNFTDLVQELPHQPFTNILIDHYFASINWTRYPLSERDFRAAYASICASGADINPNDVRFLPLLYVVLAISVRLAPEAIAGDVRTRRLTSLRYYWSSRRSLLIAAAIQPDSLEMVLTRLLSARFLTFDRRITECWSQLGAAVRTAQALGLHRDGEAMGMDPARVEYRRRIWAYLYHADRSYALVLGRPNAIQDCYTSTLPPLNIADETVLTPQLRTSPPLSQPTPMTFVILRHRLAVIIGHMVHHFQQVRNPSHYTDVLALDEELLKFINELPPYFAMEPDTSLDDNLTYIPVHRYLLITEVLFVRISLHRPYLLRKLRSDRYVPSRKACFDSAIRDFQVRRKFKAASPREARDSLSNAYREFQTAMVSGIYLVLEPRGVHSDAMHTILDQFLADHEGIPDIDETTKRELKIIEFLKNKSLQVEASGQGPSRSVESNAAVPHVDAQLLLELGQSASRSPSVVPALPRRKSVNGVGFGLPSPALAQSPKNAFRNAVPITQSRSPTLHRLQHVDTFQLSPAASGSPGVEEESTAQHLLDHWCNTISNGSFDGPNNLNPVPWNGANGTDLANLFAQSSGFMGNDMNNLAGPDISDWNYWETLVNQIRGS